MPSLGHAHVRHSLKSFQLLIILLVVGATILEFCNGFITPLSSSTRCPLSSLHLSTKNLPLQKFSSNYYNNDSEWQRKRRRRGKQISVATLHATGNNIGNEKEKYYLSLAKEAYQKHYSPNNKSDNNNGKSKSSLSEEEYLKLAMNAWNAATAATASAENKSSDSEDTEAEQQLNKITQFDDEASNIKSKQRNPYFTEFASFPTPSSLSQHGQQEKEDANEDAEISKSSPASQAISAKRSTKTNEKKKTDNNSFLDIFSNLIGNLTAGSNSDSSVNNGSSENSISTRRLLKSEQEEYGRDNTEDNMAYVVRLGINNQRVIVNDLNKNKVQQGGRHDVMEKKPLEPIIFSKSKKNLVVNNKSSVVVGPRPSMSKWVLKLQPNRVSLKQQPNKGTITQMSNNGNNSNGGLSPSTTANNQQKKRMAFSAREVMGALEMKTFLSTAKKKTSSSAATTLAKNAGEQEPKQCQLTSSGGPLLKGISEKKNIVETTWKLGLVGSKSSGGNTGDFAEDENTMQRQEQSQQPLEDKKPPVDPESRTTLDDKDDDAVFESSSTTPLLITKRVRAEEGKRIQLNRFSLRAEEDLAATLPLPEEGKQKKIEIKDSQVAKEAESIRVARLDAAENVAKSLKELTSTVMKGLGDMKGEDLAEDKVMGTISTTSSLDGVSCEDGFIRDGLSTSKEEVMGIAEAKPRRQIFKSPNDSALKGTMKLNVGQMKSKGFATPQAVAAKKQNFAPKKQVVGGAAEAGGGELSKGPASLPFVKKETSLGGGGDENAKNKKASLLLTLNSKGNVLSSPLLVKKGRDNFLTSELKGTTDEMCLTGQRSTENTLVESKSYSAVTGQNEDSAQAVSDCKVAPKIVLKGANDGKPPTFHNQAKTKSIKKSTLLAPPSPSLKSPKDRPMDNRTAANASNILGVVKGLFSLTKSPFQTSPKNKKGTDLGSGIDELLNGADELSKEINQEEMTTSTLKCSSSDSSIRSSTSSNEPSTMQGKAGSMVGKAQSKGFPSASLNLHIKGNDSSVQGAPPLGNRNVSTTSPFKSLSLKGAIFGGMKSQIMGGASMTNKKSVESLFEGKFGQLTAKGSNTTLPMKKTIAKAKLPKIGRKGMALPKRLSLSVGGGGPSSMLKVMESDPVKTSLQTTFNKGNVEIPLEFSTEGATYCAFEAEQSDPSLDGNLQPLFESTGGPIEKSLETTFSKTLMQDFSMKGPAFGGLKAQNVKLPPPPFESITPGPKKKSVHSFSKGTQVMAQEFSIEGAAFDGLEARSSTAFPSTQQMKTQTESFGFGKGMPTQEIANKPFDTNSATSGGMPPPAVNKFSVTQAGVPVTADLARERSDLAVGSPTVQRASSMNSNDKGTIILSEADEPWLAFLKGMIDETNSFPLLHVGNRIRSSVYGTTHTGFLVLSFEGNNGVNGVQYRVMPCVAKRPWSMNELKATVPFKVLTFERREQYDATDEQLKPLEPWELDAKAAAVRQYYEVEFHIMEKFDEKRALYQQLSEQKKQQQEQEENDKRKDEDVDHIANSVANEAVSKFLRVYPDDGSGGQNANDAIPEYGAAGLDVWGKVLGAGHDWLVYEGRMDSEVTVLDAIENGDMQHRLYGIQRAMNLPESCDFGDVLDIVSRSLLEDVVFLSSCNIVHRDIRPSNILCDGENQRLRLANFGNAVDLDPPRVGLQNDSLELNAPGSIANTLAADVFSVALIICQLLFSVADIVLNQQLKEVGYDLDFWLQKALAAEQQPIGLSDALDYLAERPGFWALLKSVMRPNPLRKKITADSLRQFDEVLAFKNDEIKWTDEHKKRVAREEQYLQSVLNPSSDPDEQPNDVLPPAETVAKESTLSSDEDAFNITQMPFTLQSRTKLTASTLSEVSKKIKQSAPKEDAGVISKKPLGGDYIDVTRLKFSPTRKSSLTDMLTFYAEKKVVPKQVQQQKRDLFDIKRVSFQSVPPQPSELNILKANTMEVVHIIAPSGKLGVEVDTPRPGGPTFVSNISYKSPLLGQIFLGDIIIAIDNDDMQQAMADNISKVLLSKSANACRKISVLREMNDKDELMVTSNDNDQDNSSDKSRKQTALATEGETQVDDECFQEVEQWLLSYLPRLPKVDVVNYCKCLIDDGFDSFDMFEEVVEDDLCFMKKAHQRAMWRKMAGTVNVPAQARANSPSPLYVPDHQPLLVKKVYTVDEALGQAARKGIEAKIAEQKQFVRKMSEMKEQVAVDALAKAAEEARLQRVAPRKDETEQKMREKEIMQHKVCINADEEALLQRYKDEKLKLHLELETEAVVRRAKMRKDEFQRLADEARYLEETEAWIAKQNEMVKKKHAKRISKERELREEQKMRQDELQRFTDEAKHLEETKAWIAKQNAIEKKKHAARIAKEKELREHQKRIQDEFLRLADEAKRLEQNKAWIAKQNEIVKKKDAARTDKDQELKVEEKRCAARQAELENLAEEITGLEQAEAWIAQQNELVKKRHQMRVVREKQLLEEETKDAARQLELDKAASCLKEENE